MAELVLDLVDHPVRVTVAAVKGSSPREVGASMCVWADRQSGTIGGGALEWEAAKIARAMLAAGQISERRTLPLGPALGQCCGGVVTLDFEREPTERTAPKRDLWIWGAGHVGRAIAGVMAPLGAHAVTLIDTSANRMPDVIDDQITPLIAADPTRLVRHAPPRAHHLILTYAHDIDFALCDMLLTHGFGEIGLIGSQTKWARFRKRLVALGHAAHVVDQIICPIGDPRLGKAPQAIAVGLAHTWLTTGGFAAKVEA